MKATPEDIAKYERMALERGWAMRAHVVGEPQVEPAKSKRRAKPELVEPQCAMDENFRGLRVVVALATRSETNRDGRQWRDRHKRSQEAKKALRVALTPSLHLLSVFEDHYHTRVGKLSVRFVRLGGRKMDRSNLPAAMKALEDALAYLLGADDGDPRWRADWDQEPGSGGEGVRIELAFLEEMSKP